MQTLRRLAGHLALVLLVAACAGTAAPSGGAASAAPAASASPAGGASPAPSVEPPSTDDPNAPIGTDVPPGGGVDGNPPLTIAKPGQLDVHPVRMDGLAAVTDGRRVVVTATWTSGVEPCNVLDHILVERGDRSFTITILEGHGPGNDICIEIAQIKQTQVDLGDLEPGTYAIADGEGGAAPIEVTVS